MVGIIACHTVLAQGTILFRNAGVGVDAPMYNFTGGLVAPLPEYRVALYAGNNAFQLEQLAYTSFTSPGYFGDSTPVLLPRLNPDLPIFFQVKIWNTYTGSTYEEAVSNDGPTSSTEVRVLQGHLGDSTKDPPIPPPELLGLQSVQFPGGIISWVRVSKTSIGTNGFGFNLTGSCGTIAVQATTNLANPTWVPLLSTNIPNGLLRFSDPEWTNSPSRFYLILRPRCCDPPCGGGPD